MTEMTMGEVMDRLTVTTSQIDKYTGEPVQEFQIVSTKPLREQIHTFYKGGVRKGIPLGFHHTNEGFLIREHELTIISGQNGSGKTMWLSQVCLNLLEEGHKVLIASLEMHPMLTISRMITQRLKGPNPTPEYIDKFVDDMNDNLFIYKQEGVSTSKDMYAMLNYAHLQDCKVVVIDSLMKMADINEENYDAQKRFVDRLTVIARQFPIHIFLVAHSKKLKEVNDQPTKNDVHGSNHIVNLCDNCITVWRNRIKEKKMEEDKLTDDEKRNIPDVKVFVQKQRNYIGENGEPTFNFYYDRKGMRYRDRP